MTYLAARLLLKLGDGWAYAGDFLAAVLDRHKAIAALAVLVPPTMMLAEGKVEHVLIALTTLAAICVGARYAP